MNEVAMPLWVNIVLLVVIAPLGGGFGVWILSLIKDWRESRRQAKEDNQKIEEKKEEFVKSVWKEYVDELKKNFDKLSTNFEKLSVDHMTCIEEHAHTKAELEFLKGQMESMRIQVNELRKTQ